MSTRPRGRPRDPSVDDAIRDAVRHLLVDVGYHAVTFDAIAAHARVSRPTVYRRYPAKAAAVFDAVLATAVPFASPDTGRLVDDLDEAMRGIVASLASPEARAALPGLTADLAANPALADTLRATMVEPVYRQLHDVLERARRRGDLRPDVDPTVLIDVLVGTTYSRVMFLDRTIDGDYGRDLIDLVVRGARPDQDGTRRTQ